MQRKLPGHRLQWMYGQLRDLGPQEDLHFSLKDVLDVPVFMRKGGSARSVSALVSQVGASSRDMNKPMSKQGQHKEVFIPIGDVEGLSRSELSFLRSCDITHGYFDAKRGEFVVRRDQQRFRGRGDSGCGWSSA